MIPLCYVNKADRLDRSGNCYFGKSSNCGAIIFFGVVAWIVLTGIIIYRMSSIIVQRMSMTWRTECIIFAVLSAVWILVGSIASHGNPSSNRLVGGNVVVSFSWLNVFLHLSSSLICFLGRNNDDGQFAK